MFKYHFHCVKLIVESVFTMSSTSFDYFEVFDNLIEFLNRKCSCLHSEAQNKFSTYSDADTHWEAGVQSSAFV